MNCWDSLSLPIELWRPIIANVVSKDALASLAQVSRFLQHESERILYRSVILHHPDDALVHALSTRRRTLLTHECSLYFSARTPPSFSHPLLLLLSRMRNLLALSIRGPLPPAAHKLALPFRLRTFCTTEPLSRPLVALLRAQPSIARLTLLHPAPSRPSLSLAGALPNAHTLATLTPAPALALLPHRPITHLHVLAWARTPFSSLRTSSGPLRALLCAQGLNLTASDLGLLTMRIPHLAFLGDCVITEDVAAYLPSLSRLPLKTLLVNRASPGLSKRFSEAGVVKAFGGACAALERVVFTQRGTAGHVWERTGEEWIMVHVWERAGEEWVRVQVEDPCEVAADLWRAA